MKNSTLDKALDIETYIGHDPGAYSHEELSEFGRIVLAFVTCDEIQQKRREHGAGIAYVYMDFVMRSKYANVLRPLVAAIDDAVFPETSDESCPNLVTAIERLGASPLILRFIPEAKRHDVFLDMSGESDEMQLLVLLDAALKSFFETVEEDEQDTSKFGIGVPRDLDDVARQTMTKLLCIFSLLGAVPACPEVLRECSSLEFIPEKYWGWFNRELLRTKLRTVHVDSVPDSSAG
ncbi:MAG: hypothetical protein V1745_00635 [Patescibacteria group bacterium]